MITNKNQVTSKILVEQWCDHSTEPRDFYGSDIRSVFSVLYDHCAVIKTRRFSKLDCKSRGQMLDQRRHYLSVHQITFEFRSLCFTVKCNQEFLTSTIFLRSVNLMGENEMFSLNKHLFSKSLSKSCINIMTEFHDKVCKLKIS